MLKSDKHMTSVKSRLLKQQVKIKTFEEKKQRAENKKFHKAIKDFKMKAKHQEKRDNQSQINKLKQTIRDRGDNIEEKDFKKIMYDGVPNTPGRGSKAGKRSVIDKVKQQVS